MVCPFYSSKILLIHFIGWSKIQVFENSVHFLLAFIFYLFFIIFNDCIHLNHVLCPSPFLQDKRVPSFSHRQIFRSPFHVGSPLLHLSQLYYILFKMHSTLYSRCECLLDWQRRHYSASSFTFNSFHNNAKYEMCLYYSYHAPNWRLQWATDSDAHPQSPISFSCFSYRKLGPYAYALKCIILYVIK